MSHIYRHVGPTVNVYWSPYTTTYGEIVGKLGYGEQFVAHTAFPQKINGSDHYYLEISFVNSSGTFMVGYLNMTGVGGYSNTLYGYCRGMWRYNYGTVTIGGVSYNKFKIQRGTYWLKPDGSYGGALSVANNPYILCKGSDTGATVKDTIATTYVFDNSVGKYITTGGLIFVKVGWNFSPFPSKQSVQSVSS